MKQSGLILLLIISLGLGCDIKNKAEQTESTNYLSIGIWRGAIRTQGIDIPFQFDVQENDGKYTIFLINDSERIPLDDISISNDSIHVPMYVFDATIHAKIGKDKLVGVWVKNYADDYIVPFEAKLGDIPRFIVDSSAPVANFEGEWEVDFIEEKTVEKAIGVFKQSGNRATGTFLLSTGDYRFLEGVVDGEVMKLSCFDGTHAYLFEATLQENGEISGEFWSGKSWHQQWTAKHNDSFELPDPYSLSFIKEGYDTFEINFPNTEGKQIQLTDEKYKDKIVVVQVLGTWCPNCLDETSFFVDWQKRNKDKKVEFIGLAFEYKDDPQYAITRINRMKSKLDINYEILIAGSTQKESKEKALPMLNRIISFPTTIILDKHHKVRKIHVGFSGPGTGYYYEKYVEEFNLFMDKLLAE